MTLGEGIARSQRAIKDGLSDTVEGTCVSVDWAAGLVVVNIGGGLVPMPMVGDAPWPNDKVRVAYLGQKPVCLGIRARSVIGTVLSSASGGKIAVIGDDNQSYNYAYNADATPSAGDRVRLDHAAQMVVCEISSEAKLAPVNAPKSADQAGVKDATFYPVDSGNFRFGAYQDNGVEISDNRSAFYYYDQQIEGTIPDSATILAATIWLNQEWDNLPGTASHLGTHTHARRSSEPALSGVINVNGGSQVLDIMAAADALKTGAALGVGFYAGFGWRKFSGNAFSGQIYMKWRV